MKRQGPSNRGSFSRCSRKRIRRAVQVQNETVSPTNTNSPRTSRGSEELSSIISDAEDAAVWAELGDIPNALLPDAEVAIRVLRGLFPRSFRRRMPPLISQRVVHALVANHAAADAEIETMLDADLLRTIHTPAIAADGMVLMYRCDYEHFLAFTMLRGVLHLESGRSYQPASAQRHGDDQPIHVALTQRAAVLRYLLHIWSDLRGVLVFSKAQYRSSLERGRRRRKLHGYSFPSSKGSKKADVCDPKSSSAHSSSSSSSCSRSSSSSGDSGTGPVERHSDLPPITTKRFSESDVPVETLRLLDDVDLDRCVEADLTHLSRMGIVTSEVLDAARGVEYRIGVPSIGIFVNALRNARTEILQRMRMGNRYGEVSLTTASRWRLRSTTHIPADYVIRDLLGLQYVECTETAGGRFLRLTAKAPNLPRKKMA